MSCTVVEFKCFSKSSWNWAHGRVYSKRSHWVHNVSLRLDVLREGSTLDNSLISEKWEVKDLFYSSFISNGLFNRNCPVSNCHVHAMPACELFHCKTTPKPLISMLVCFTRLWLLSLQEVCLAQYRILFSKTTGYNWHFWHCPCHAHDGTCHFRFRLHFGCLCTLMGWLEFVKSGKSS